MTTPFFDAGSYGWKDFGKDCLDGGEGVATLILPFGISAYAPVVPRVLGIPFTLLAAPIMLAERTIDYISRARQEWKRSKIGPAEQSIRDTFGNIATKAMAALMTCRT